MYSNIGTRESARIYFPHALKQCPWEQTGPKNARIHARLVWTNGRLLGTLLWQQTYPCSLKFAHAQNYVNNENTHSESAATWRSKVSHNRSLF